MDQDDTVMETSEENQQSTAQRKRKANEIEDVGDAGSGGEGQDDREDTDGDVSSREGFQEWDVDSFEDGHEFIPNKKIDPNDEEAQKMRRYRIQMYESNGFNVDRENYPGRVAYRELIPVNLDEPFNSGLTGRAYMQNNVDLTLHKYNKINGLSLTCANIVRAVVCRVSGSVKSYITFMARETPDAEDLIEYQAKTEQMPWQKRAHALFCRRTPKPKVIHVPRYEDCVSDSSTDSNASSRGSDQAWEVDSFDDESEYQPQERMCPIEEEVQRMRLYRPKMYPSKGFHVDGETYRGETVFFSQVDLDANFPAIELTGREHMQNLVDLALEKLNNIKGTSVTCESIVRANLTRVNGYKLYITFMARESPEEEPVEYQAKTERKFWQRKYHAMFCRPAPKSKD
ncbi:Cystatin/monellin superfamily protein [Raphanus sativus]|uniref:Uncharacterized protein LOC108863562 n=1 Tax=Raphanus sativus TaxID=3726 RepID=A0A6J0PA19_RAPSA|nr:uncharacterized protein LOC108863562 [Raphanus sativus]KAJ4893014.1 Cystatin/monellin superfamily protein [Raphanus sativus]